MKFVRFICGALLALCMQAVPARANDLRVGVYYFPGWIESDFAPPGGWAPIKRFPEREPMLGWYRMDDADAMARQLRWMKDHGIDYVTFDWYHSYGDVRVDEAIETYKRIPATGVAFNLMWANHDDATTPAIWRKIVGIWITRYLKDPRYLKVGAKPVVSILSFEKLRNDAQASRSNVAAYIAEAQRMARRAGLAGIYFIGGSDDTSTNMMRVEAPQAGFDAISAYNYHRKPAASAARDPNWGRLTRGYAGMDAAYREQWREAMKLPIPFVVPMMSGWDRTPWGGTDDRRHDGSIATPAQFGAHLAAARQIMETQGKAYSGLGIICCWNEYGEGSFIEPTRRGGFAYLQQVKRVFGAAAEPATGSSMRSRTPPARRAR